MSHRVYVHSVSFNGGLSLIPGLALGAAREKVSQWGLSGYGGDRHAGSTQQGPSQRSRPHAREPQPALLGEQEPLHLMVLSLSPQREHKLD